MQLCQVGLISGLNMREECHSEFTAEREGVAEQQTETQGDAVNQEARTHADTRARTHTDVDAHKCFISSRKSYPVISLLMKSALMTWM